MIQISNDDASKVENSNKEIKSFNLYKSSDIENETFIINGLSFSYSLQPRFVYVYEIYGPDKKKITEAMSYQSIGPF